MNRQQQFSIMMFLQYAIWGSWTTALGAYLNKIGFAHTTPILEKRAQESRLQKYQLGWVH